MKIQFCLSQGSQKFKNNENNSNRSMKIHSGQNLSHTNDQIQRPKSILYMIKNTEIDVHLKHLRKKEIFQYFCKDFDLLHYVTIEANFKQYYKNSHSLQIAKENFDFVNSRFLSYFQNVNDQRLRRLGPQIFAKL